MDAGELVENLRFVAGLLKIGGGWKDDDAWCFGIFGNSFVEAREDRLDLQ